MDYIADLRDCKRSLSAVPIDIHRYQDMLSKTHIDINKFMRNIISDALYGHDQYALPS